MSEALQERFDALTRDFVRPLLTGGTLMLGQAIGPGSISYFEHANSGDDSNAVIYDALHRQASGIAPLFGDLWPRRGPLLLAMAAHNLLLLTDPMLDRVFARGSRRSIAAWVQELVEMVEPPQTRSDALCRHAMLAPLSSVRRRDVVVKNWAYTYRFFGRPVPANVVAMPKLRFVREQKSTADVRSLMNKLAEESDLDPWALMDSLLSRSPLSACLLPEELPKMRFSVALLASLSDDALRGGVAREIAALGEWTYGAGLGRALGEPWLVEAPADLLYYALALCFEVHMTSVLDVPGPALPVDLDLSDPDLARYAAVLPAFFDDESMLDEVRAFAPAHRAEVQDRCGRLRTAVPPEIMEQVRPLVARCQRSSISNPPNGGQS